MRCPWCRSDFSFQALRERCGILTCYCNRFPVIDGIPVLRRGLLSGAAVDRDAPQSVSRHQLIGLLEWGRTREALRRCLAAPKPTPRLSMLLGPKLAGSALLQRYQYWLGKRALDRLLVWREALSAKDLLRFFDMDDEPFVAPPLGWDSDFRRVWIARYWVAPTREFVCCDPTVGLPFATDKKAGPAQGLRRLRGSWGSNCAYGVPDTTMPTVPVSPSTCVVTGLVSEPSAPIL